MFHSFSYMSGFFKNSARGMLVLVALGVLALYAGPKSLFILIPTALLIWHGIAPVPRSGRN